MWGANNGADERKGIVSSQEIFDLMRAQYREFTAVRHKTLDDVMGAMAGDIGEPVFASMDSDGNIEDYSHEQLQDGVKQSGIFGYVDSLKNEIHYWMAEGLSFEQRLWFFGHELGHAIPQIAKRRNEAQAIGVAQNPDEISEDEQDAWAALAEESEADQYAWVATEAYRLAMQTKRGGG
jgi:hypothetical protein